jgi:hypothetical protein
LRRDRAQTEHWDEEEHECPGQNVPHQVGALELVLEAELLVLEHPAQEHYRPGEQCGGEQRDGQGSGPPGRPPFLLRVVPQTDRDQRPEQGPEQVNEQGPEVEPEGFVHAGELVGQVGHPD